MLEQQEPASVNFFETEEEIEAKNNEGIMPCRKKADKIIFNQDILDDDKV